MVSNVKYLHIIYGAFIEWIKLSHKIKKHPSEYSADLKLPLKITKIEITLDRCFFTHLFLVKGYFCSLLVSSIIYFTSLSTEYAFLFLTKFPNHISFSFFLFYFPVKRDSFMWEYFYEGILLKLSIHFKVKI